MTLASCGNDAEYTVKENQAFITQTGTNANSSQKLTIGTEKVSTDLSIRLSSPTSVDCSFEFTVDPEILDEYNKLNVTDYKVLPAEFYSFSTTSIDVKTGEVLSNPVTLTVSPLSDELKNNGLKYAIPVRLKSADGKKEVLESGGKYVILIDQVVIQPVPVLNRVNWVKANFGNAPFDFSAWTLEFCVNMDLLGTAVGQYNNQALFSGMSSTEEIYVRFGDAPIKGNIFQVKTQGTQMNSNMEFSANTWYHIAVVCTGTKLYYYVNGVLDNSMDLPGKTYRTADDGSWSMCNTSYFKANAMFSEVRFWTKARSQQEIANNMYVCDPNSDGLQCYFKMNEGSGNIFNDATGHGGHAEVQGGEPTWVQDVRIDGK